MTTQVVLESAETAAEYDSARVVERGGSDVIRRDMAFDRSRDNVYVITSSQVRSSLSRARGVYIVGRNPTLYWAVGRNTRDQKLGNRPATREGPN